MKGIWGATICTRVFDTSDRGQRSDPASARLRKGTPTVGELGKLGKRGELDKQRRQREHRRLGESA